MGALGQTMQYTCVNAWFCTLCLFGKTKHVQHCSLLSSKMCFRHQFSTSGEPLWCWPDPFWALSGTLGHTFNHRPLLWPTFPILVCSWVPSGCTKGTLEEPKGSKMDLKCAPGDPKGVPLEPSWHLLSAKHDQTCIFKIVKNPLVFPFQMPNDRSRWDIWACFGSEDAIGWFEGMMVR